VHFHLKAKTPQIKKQHKKKTVETEAEEEEEAATCNKNCIINIKWRQLAIISGTN